MLDLTLIKVKAVVLTDSYGKFDIEPLDKGFGQTVGTSLRRILLSSLKGAAVTSVKINNIKHEYASIPGVEEDVMNIILNLKQLRLKCFSDEKQTLYLNVKRSGAVTAADIETTSTVEILNKDLVIAHISDDKSTLSIELTVEVGIGYNPVEEERTEIGLIPVDASFSPVDRVNFAVTSARVGQVTDLDKLTFEIYTRTIEPREALQEALKISTGVLARILESTSEESEVATPETIVADEEE